MRALLPLLALGLWLGTTNAPAQEFDAGPDHTLEPLPAEIMPLAPRSTLLSVQQAEGQFVAVGDRGHILTSPGGNEWQQVASPVRRMLTRVRFDTPRHGWAVGYDAAILQSIDAGRSWQVRHFDAAGEQPLYGIQFVDADTAFAVGGRGLVLRTDDGGANWEPVENDVFDLQFHLFDITRLNDGTLLIVAEKGLLARSTDDGESWEMLEPAYTGSFFGALPHGESGALVFGLRGHAYLLPEVPDMDTENPLTWDEFEAATVEDPEELEDLGYRLVPTGTLQGLFGGAILPDGGYALVGVNGIVLQAGPNLAQFREVRNPTPYTLNQAIATAGRLLAVGRRGATWIPLP